MVRETILDNRPSCLEKDLMAIRKIAMKVASIRSKIERTGLTESYCYTCNKTLSIANFPIKKTGTNGGKNKKKRMGRPRKNTPAAPYIPRRECNKCIEEKKRQNGQHERDKTARRQRYHSNKDLRKALKEGQKRARALLSNSYIRKLLLATGYTDEQIKQNPQLIEDRKKWVLKLRERKEKGLKHSLAVERMTDGYMRKLISDRLHIPRNQITLQQIIDGRIKLEEKRRIEGKRYL